MSDETATPAPLDDGEFGHELLMLWVVGATAIVTLVAAGLVDTAGKAIAGAVTFTVLSAVACLPWPSKWGVSGTRNAHELGNGDGPLVDPHAGGRSGCPVSAWGPDSTLADGLAGGQTRPVDNGHEGGQILRPGRSPGSIVPSEPDDAAGVWADENLRLQDGNWLDTGLADRGRFQPRTFPSAALNAADFDSSGQVRYTGRGPVVVAEGHDLGAINVDESEIEVLC